MQRLFLILVLLLCFGFETARSAECTYENGSDGADYNQRRGIIAKIGPPGAQNGHPNPVGIPPGIQDLEVTYLSACGWEFNAGIVPGFLLNVGLRHRVGEVLYGAIGTGLLLTPNGLGPGVYSAIGASVRRIWPFTFEAEFKQSLGIGFGGGPTHIISPWALRIGVGYYWE